MWKFINNEEIKQHTSEWPMVEEEIEGKIFKLLNENGSTIYQN